MKHLHKYVALLTLAFLPLLVVGQVSQTFNCPPLPPRTAAPTHIKDLHPADVKIMMAMGDSFISGFGMLGTFEEARGQSFCAGGDVGAITVPNFLLNYNANLTGFSTGTPTAQVCYGPNCNGPQYTATDGNNAAKSGSMIVDMASYQINYLIRQINQKSNMDVDSDWKVLSILTGIDDFCATCAFNSTYLSPDEYKFNLMGTLERIRSSLPRTFVNLILAPNVSQAYELGLRSDCFNVRRTLFVQCSCVFDPANGALRQTFDALLTGYNQAAQQVVNYYRTKSYSNFAVVVQPFLANTQIYELPTSYLSRVDCFHPSQAGQQAMAIALWNNMLSPSDLKQQYLNMSDTPICPTADTLLYTD